MNPLNLLGPYLGLAKILAVVALMGGLLAAKHHYDHKIIDRVNAEWQAKELAATIKADSELAAANEKVRAAQALLTAAQANLTALQTEFDNEQIVSTALQHDIASGAHRMSIVTITHNKASAAEPAASGPTATVGDGTETVEDIAPAAAVAIERLRANENAAIDRLNACVSAYDAVKAAADSLEGSNDNSTELRQ